jgi:hypothetical protein
MTPKEKIEAAIARLKILATNGGQSPQNELLRDIIVDFEEAIALLDQPKKVCKYKKYTNIYSQWRIRPINHKGSSLPSRTKQRVCPYCGRKIEVVE